MMKNPVPANWKTANLTIEPDNRVSLKIPGIIEFANYEATHAIKAVKHCIGLSEIERKQVIEAIYKNTEPKRKEGRRLY
jgi:hypothetical protein